MEDKTKTYLIIGCLALLCLSCVIGSILGGYFLFRPNTSTNADTNPKSIIPRLSTISDCGYSSMTRGWYDIQGQGVKNDYCRSVGGGSDPLWFSCALAGSTNQYTPSSRVIDPNLPHDPPSGTPCP